MRCAAREIAILRALVGFYRERAVAEINANVRPRELAATQRRAPERLVLLREAFERFRSLVAIARDQDEGVETREVQEIVAGFLGGGERANEVFVGGVGLVETEVAEGVIDGEVAFRLEIGALSRVGEPVRIGHSDFDELADDLKRESPHPARERELPTRATALEQQNGLGELGRRRTRVTEQEVRRAGAGLEVAEHALVLNFRHQRLGHEAQCGHAFALRNALVRDEQELACRARVRCG